MKIYLIRHGQTDANFNAIIQGRTDNKMNQTGIDQAIMTGKFLKQEHIDFDYCVSSPLNRARHTAKIIKDYLKLDLKTHIEPALIERDFGALDGQKIPKDYYKMVHDGLVDDMETDSEIEARVKDYFNDFFNKHDHENVLMIAHSHVIKALLVQYLDDFDYDTYLNNCSINILEWDDGIHIIKHNINPLI